VNQGRAGATEQDLLGTRHREVEQVSRIRRSQGQPDQGDRVPRQHERIVARIAIQLGEEDAQRDPPAIAPASNSGVLANAGMMTSAAATPTTVPATGRAPGWPRRRMPPPWAG
jgi:hypothetical protein